MNKKSNPAVFAAIAMALYELKGEFAHDDTKMKLTIRRSVVPSAWAMKTNLLRQEPKRHF